MVKQQQSPHEKIDNAQERVGVDVTEELQAIRGVLPHLRTKIQSIQEDSYYRNSMVSAVCADPHRSGPLTAVCPGFRQECAEENSGVNAVQLRASPIL